jgi:hypothetical protein
MDWTHTGEHPTEAQDPRAYEETFIRWIPLAVPLLAVLLLLCVFLIEADVL